MKLSEFLPKQAQENEKLIESNRILESMYKDGFMSFVKSKYGDEKSAIQYYGVEQLYFDWLRTAYSYRRQFLQDLYLLGMDVSEIRGPLLQLRGEVFRKGFNDWIPKFAVRCKKCHQEHTDKVQKCECGSESFEEPDKEQYYVFEQFRRRANMWGNSLEEVLYTFEDDLNIADDAFLRLVREYRRVGDKVLSRVVELRRVHPALIEIDLDKSGLPKNSHWACPIHREKIQTKPGTCAQDGCGLEMFPAMYIHNHRGERVYLFEEEIIHCSKFSPSETYGYCYDDETQILTKNRGWQFFKDLNKNDFVATLNPENDELVYQKPINIWSQKYVGKMYELGDNKTKLVSLKITPNHKHYAKLNNETQFSLQEANSLLNKRFVSKIGGANWVGIEKEFFTLDEVSFYSGGANWKNKHSEVEPEINLIHCPKINVKMDIWLEFLGYYLSEGDLHEGINSGQVRISQKFKTEKWQKIKKCLEKLGFIFRYYGHKFIINDVRVHHYLVKFGNVHDKFIPEEFKELSQRQLRILFEALMLGDGSWREYPNSGSYKSVSKRLLEDVTEIIMKLGYSSRLWSYDKYGINSISILFTDKKEIELNKGKKSDALIDYDGTIYCCEVSKYNILLVRRKGRTVF